jgi:hypothetical protein
MRPVLPRPDQVPFEVPDSIRLLDPTLPEGATLLDPPPAGWFDPAGNAITPPINHLVIFGWEYVWHCHILAHEEMDMMHSLTGVIPPRAPTLGIPVWNGFTNNNRRVTLNWTDNSIKEAGFRVERATDANFTMGLASFNLPANTVTFDDTTIGVDITYWYRVFALGDVVGDTGTPGFPTASANAVSNSVSVIVGTPTANVTAVPTNLTATLQSGPRVTVAWRDNANNETGIVVERCGFVPSATVTTCADFAQIAVAPPRNNTGNTSWIDTTVLPGNSYLYRVIAVNANVVPPYPPTSYATLVTPIAVPALPLAPTNFNVTAVKAGGNNYTARLTWTDNATNETGFTVQRATNLQFTTGLSTTNVAANAVSLNQNVSRNSTYYYRIRANNLSGSSAWVNALPFPIRTGP